MTTATSRAIEKQMNSYREYITDHFVSKGLGEFRLSMERNPADGKVRTVAKFLDPKDQFKYTLLGGEDYRAQLMDNWIALTLDKYT
jgi:hypothetical protein